MDTPLPETCAMEMYMYGRLDPHEANPQAPPRTMSNSDLALHDALNTLLADSFALYLKTKSFHWHVTGPHFREYHLMFDEQATSILGTTDVMAERIRKAGGSTLRSIGNIVRLQRIKDNEKEELPANQMVAELLDNNRALIASIRGVKLIADRDGDIATSAMTDAWIDQAEERVWVLAATLGN